MSMPKATIIVRTKNEARWIASCLDSIFSQTFRDFEVILVDDHSVDGTLEIVAKYPAVRVLKYNLPYRPGRALNFGIKEAKGEFVVMISGHCIPTNAQWLEKLLSGFESEEVAAVYGRQQPLSFSSDRDKRDLLLVFGLDRKVQRKDSFFHNANSAIRKSLWDQIPFDDEITNIEDRVWAERMIGMGKTIVYEPEASVFHWHGIHQDGDDERCRNVVRILESLKLVAPKGDDQPKKSTGPRIACIVPSRGNPLKFGPVDLLQRTLDLASSVDAFGEVFLASENADSLQARAKGKISLLSRPHELSLPHVSLEEVVAYSAGKIKEQGKEFDAFFVMTENYPLRSRQFIEDLIKQFFYKKCKVLIPGFQEARPLVKRSTEGEWEWADSGFMPRTFRDPVFICAPGLGSMFEAGAIGASFSSGAASVFELRDKLIGMEVRSNEALEGLKSIVG
jgi:hypothetical protein